MNTKLPVIKKENIFTKIKNFIIRIFNKRKQKESEEIENLNNDVKKYNREFINNIKVKDMSNIYELSRKLKSKKIKIADLSDKELDEMISFYENIVDQKRNKLIRYRKQLKNI